MNGKTPIAPLDIVIPIAIELDWPKPEVTAREIIEQHERYGFTRFALAAPCGGWRSVGFPPRERFESLAKFFLEVKEAVAPHGLECGWWITATIKSGGRADFTPITKPDGTPVAFASCPLGENFRREFSECVALFCSIAKPAFIFTEDDYSVCASAGKLGCFCDRHVSGFAEREKRPFTRETLLAALTEETPQSRQLLARWQKFTGETLIGLAERIRAELDIASPEIPMGPMQQGNADREGVSTEELARAMAGRNHMPFSRIYGAFYSAVETKRIPRMLYHALYTKQHLKGPFFCYHESDTYPHTRFFISAAHMRTILGSVYSYGFDGSTFQTQQLLDDPNEEKAHGDLFCRERARFEAVHQAAKQCRLGGVEIGYDPFFNTSCSLVKSDKLPLWLKAAASFAIPYTTLPAPVALWDANCAACADDETVEKYLSKGLVLDGDAAKVLCDRGYAADLGVMVGENVTVGRAATDLGEREVIREEYCTGKGKNMPSAHMYSPHGCGNGILRQLTVLDEKCEVLTEEYSFRHEYIAPAMTRYQNARGGRIVVMGLTLDGNGSHALLNYRRQRLVHELLRWCGDTSATVEECANVFVIQNEALCPEASGFTGMLTITCFAEDGAENVRVHLPKHWQNTRTVLTLQRDGEWTPADASREGSDLILRERLGYLDPVYLKFI